MSTHTPCPEWCQDATRPEVHREKAARGETVTHFSSDVRIPAYGGRSVAVALGQSEGAAPLVDVNGVEFTAEQARALAREIVHRADSVTPASPEAVDVVRVAADALDIGWEELAAVAGVDLSTPLTVAEVSGVDLSTPLTVAEVSSMARTAGQWRARAGDHLLRTLNA